MRPSGGQARSSYLLLFILSFEFSKQFCKLELEEELWPSSRPTLGCNSLLFILSFKFSELFCALVLEEALAPLYAPPSLLNIKLLKFSWLFDLSVSISLFSFGLNEVFWSRWPVKETAWCSNVPERTKRLKE